MLSALMVKMARSTGHIPVHAGMPMFAPSAPTNDATSSLTPTSSVSCFTVTGMVPMLDCDVNATTCAGQMALKNLMGFILANTETKVP